MKKKHLFIFLSALFVCLYLILYYEEINPGHDDRNSSNHADEENLQPNDLSTIAPSPTTTAATEQPIPSPTQASVNEQQIINQQIDQLLNSLTLQQKIGQLLIIGIDDNQSEVSEQTTRLIKEQGIGNIILFKRNIKNNAQLSSLILNLKKLPSEPSLPLWITIDQEGGKVNRLPQQFPAAQDLAKLDDVASTKQTGLDMGKELADLKFDMNFAPVLDVNNNPDNPVIGSRAFGSDPQTVVKHSLAMLDGLDDYVFTVGKHFPGHGDTNIDSHHSLPIIDKSWEELEALELIPFRAAIEQQIDAIMVGHLYLPQIDDQYPASLSPTIITNYLRDVLEFSGIIISDDLEMGGITENYEIGEAAVLALQAGNTMLIIGHDPNQQQAVINAIRDAVEKNKLSEKLIDENVSQVLRMKLNRAAYLNK